MTDPYAVIRQMREALVIGLASAEAEAAAYHEAMKGYRPQRHASVDAEVETIRVALAAADAALGEHS